ncbi:MAG: Arc family DNA-binding protein, partial [Longimicrobiales bacterium]|nr:Arc family DNA-binding protein [Longimicrobiales bacterium]
MADVALRGISPALHRALKAAAERNHRSLNSEILVRLESSLGTSTVDVDVLLSRIRTRKERFRLLKLDENELRRLR